MNNFQTSCRCTKIHEKGVVLHFSIKHCEHRISEVNTDSVEEHVTGTGLDDSFPDFHGSTLLFY